MEHTLTTCRKWVDAIICHQCANKMMTLADEPTLWLLGYACTGCNDRFLLGLNHYKLTLDGLSLFEQRMLSGGESRLAMLWYFQGSAVMIQDEVPL